MVALTNRWRFPSRCESSSPRRSVSISTFVSSEDRFLKITEACTNGKIFFVLIPALSLFEGWKKLLSLCQNWIVSALAPPPPPMLSTHPPVANPSYVVMVKGPTFSTHSRCSNFSLNGVAGIKVEDTRTSDRLAYLDCCLVFRFCSQSSIDWTRFRRWTNINWGLALNAPLQKLDDDLWLLFCDSKSKVDQILSLNCRDFEGIEILLDKWIPEAGRSKVLEEENIQWITIRGIPAHFRSSDLIRRVGMICGVFLGYEVCSSLSSVRVKIRLTGSLPESIPISFGSKEFSLQALTIQQSLPVSSPEDLSACKFKTCPLVQRTVISSEFSVGSAFSSPTKPFVGLRLDDKDNLWLSKLGFLQSSIDMASPLSQEEVHSSEGFLLSAIVREAANLFGFVLEGSKESGVDAAIATCEEVASRRA
ncbi:hypothetical protein LINPERHAP2_LOCUS33433 [Linum perenne]